MKYVDIKFGVRQRSLRTTAIVVYTLWDDIEADTDEWQMHDDMLNDILCDVIDDAISRFGAQEFGYALIDAGMEVDDAETLVDVSLPYRQSIYDIADIWEDNFNKAES